MRTQCLIASTVLLLAAAPAPADEPASRPADGLWQRLLQRFDTDGDGRLSAAERTEMRKALDRLREPGEPAEPAKQTVFPGKTDLYELADGPLAVEAVGSLALHDAARDKDLPLRITFPEADGKYPLIIWSHGAGGSKDAYQPLVRYWVSRGYVCIQPTHEDSLALQPPGAGFDLKNILAKTWQSRPADVKFVLDSLGEIEKKIPALAGRIDRDRIGVGGHSFGAHTSQLIGGVTQADPRTGKATSYADPRVKCVLLVSPQGVEPGRAAASWKTLTRPAMIITGTNDLGRGGQLYTWRLDVFKYAPPPEKYLVLIDGAYHGFGGIAGPIRFPSSGPSNPDHVYYVKTTSLAFWDAYLKAATAAVAFLASNKLETATHKAVSLQRK